MGVLITRDELYDLVWSKPITKIAKDYRVSDSAIIKVCKKMEIPRPGLGYWTKVDCGKTVEVSPLPKLTSKGVDRHYLWRQGYTDGQVDEKGEVHPAIAREALEDSQLIVPEELNDPHRLTAVNVKRFKNAKADERGILTPRTPEHFDLKIAKGSVDRSMRIMDTLLKAFEEREWAFKVCLEPKLAMTVRVLHQDIRFSIEESIQAIEHVETEKEKRAKARGNWTWPPRYDHTPSGRLKLAIHTFYYYRGRSSWADGKVQRVEKCLNKFCAGLVQYAEATRLKNRKDEHDRIVRVRHSRARAREHAREENDVRMRDQLLSEVKSWKQAEEVRAYVAASRTAFAVTGSSEEIYTRWAGWALDYADSIDPLGQK